MCHDSFRTLHLSLVNPICKRAKIRQPTHTCNHIVFLHPLRVYWSSCIFSFFSSFKHCYMVVENKSATTPVFGAEFWHASALGACSSLYIMNFIRMMAETFQICRPVNGYVVKQFALAAFLSTVHFSGFHVVKEMLLVSMTTEAGGTWPNHFAIHSFSVSP